MASEAGVQVMDTWPYHGRPNSIFSKKMPPGSGSRSADEAAVPQTEANLRLAETGDLDGLRRLIAHAPNLLDARAARPPNLTLLTTAAASGQHAAVNLLLKGGASVNATDGYEGTPLLRAARGGHIDCVSTLCEAGAAVVWHCSEALQRGGSVRDSAPN